MFDSSLITYAISLHFPQNVNRIIISTVKAIAEITGNSFIIEKKIPPHITIGAFHAAKKEESILLQLVEEFTTWQQAGIVKFTGIGNFNKKVLFLRPERNSFLEKINSELHSLLQGNFEKAENGLYLPEMWFPHTTLATRLNKSQFYAAEEITKQISLPFEAGVTELSVYQCPPFAKLKKFKLGH